MGGSSSRSSSDIFLKSVNDAFVKNINECVSSQSLTQEINIVGDGNIISGGGMVQVQKLSVNCAQDSTSIAKMQNEVSQKIKEAVSSQNEALMGALQSSSANVNQKIHDEVVNTINLENINRIVNNTNAAQGINIHGNNNLIRGFTMEEAQDIMAQNAQKVVQQMSTVNAISQALDQTATSTNTNPISEIVDSVGNAVANAWNAFTGPIKWIVILIIVVAIAYLISGGFGMGGDSTVASKVAPISAAIAANASANQPATDEEQKSPMIVAV